MKLLRVALLLLAVLVHASALPRSRKLPRLVEGCGQGLPSGQFAGKASNVIITSGSVQRSFLVFVPPGYHTDQPTPAIFSYHGGLRTAEDQLNLDQLTSPQYNPGSFVIYPQGINNTWQGVPGVTTDDVAFTAEILDYVQSQYCIDTTRIFSTGKSDGAGFNNILACDAHMSLRFAAFAPVSGAFYIDTLPCQAATVPIPCDAQRDNIPFVEFHGGNDTTIHYDGGERKNECLPSISHFIQDWALRDNLGDNNVSKIIAPDTTRFSFGAGDDAGLVEHYFESNIGHDWPSTLPNADNQAAGHHVANYNATPIIVDFFGRHSLPADLLATSC